MLSDRHFSLRSENCGIDVSRLRLTSSTTCATRPLTPWIPRVWLRDVSARAWPGELLQESPAKYIPSLHHLRSRELSFFFSFRLRPQTLESAPDVVEWFERVKT